MEYPPVLTQARRFFVPELYAQQLNPAFRESLKNRCNNREYGLRMVTVQQDVWGTRFKSTDHGFIFVKQAGGGGIRYETVIMKKLFHSGPDGGAVLHYGKEKMPF